MCSLFPERRQEFHTSSSQGGQGSSLGIFRAGSCWDHRAGYRMILGQVPWGADCGDGHWITQHGGI